MGPPCRQFIVGSNLVMQHMAVIASLRIQVSAKPNVAVCSILLSMVTGRKNLPVNFHHFSVLVNYIMQL